MVQLKILFSAMNSQGHINQCLVLAELLAKRGHKIIFAQTKGWEQFIRNRSFEFIEINMETESDSGSSKEKVAPNQRIIEFIQSKLADLRAGPWEALRNVTDEKNNRTIELIASFWAHDNALKKVLPEIDADVIIIDTVYWIPCLMKSTIPWIQLWSSNPMMVYTDYYEPEFPPAEAGFPSNTPKWIYTEFSKLYSQAYGSVYNATKSWLESHGIKVEKEFSEFKLFTSPYMNIYNYPEALDYHDIIPRPPKWFRVDSKVREPDEKTPFKIPDNLIDKPGKLIYFSLGTMGCVDVELMNRIIGVLAKSPHRFIVSKGPLHEQIQLADNMWGDRYVNQIAILPHVDLVITHGGNNTLTESLTFAKPMIVMPLLFDQPDNAQRIHEKGLGIRLYTYSFKDHELLDAIEILLRDECLKEKLKKISESLAKSTTREEAIRLIELTATTKQSPFSAI